MELGDEPFSSFSELISHYFLNEDLSDFRIDVSNGESTIKSFPCHSFVLKSRSKFFRKLFESKLKESRENKLTLNSSEIAVKSALVYVYRYQIELPESPTDLFECSSLADQWGFVKLVAACQKSLQNNLTIENVRSCIRTFVRSCVFD